MSEIRLFYRFELATTTVQAEATSGAAGAVAPVHKLAVTKECGEKPETLEVSYKAALPPVSELAVDASSALGLFRERRQTLSEDENERLERCLSDLLLCQLHPHLQEEDAVILIEGPPLPKLIGRIAYRYPRPEVTIAFITVDPRYFSAPLHPPAVPDRNREWDGPFPDEQEESLTRCFYSRSGSQLRVDFFTQAPMRSLANPEGVNASSGLSKELDRQASAIRKFAQALLERRKAAVRPVPVTPELRSSKMDRSQPSGNYPLPMDQSRPADVNPALKIAARNEPSAEPRNDRHIPVTNSFPKKAGTECSDYEAFQQVFGALASKTAKLRFAELAIFASRTGLGALADQGQFLEFLHRTLVKTGRDSGSWVFSQKDLIQWYNEFQAEKAGFGRPSD